MKFQVNAGVHIHNGRLYGKGDIVESPHDLRENFREKFTLMEDSIQDTHQAHLRRPSVKQVAQQVGVTVGGPGPTEEVMEALPTVKPPARTTGPQGKDMTERFALAKEQDFKVFRHEGKYFVYDADDMTIVNKEGVEKDGVETVIKEAIKD